MKKEYRTKSFNVLCAVFPFVFFIENVLFKLFIIEINCKNNTIFRNLHTELAIQTFTNLTLLQWQQFLHW